MTKNETALLFGLIGDFERYVKDVSDEDISFANFVAWKEVMEQGDLSNDPQADMNVSEFKV